MTDTTARGMPGEPRRRPDRHLQPLLLVVGYTAWRALPALT
jgi:hypothetical protein